MKSAPQAVSSTLHQSLPPRLASIRQFREPNSFPFCIYKNSATHPSPFLSTKLSLFASLFCSFKNVNRFVFCSLRTLCLKTPGCEPYHRTSNHFRRTMRWCRPLDLPMELSSFIATHAQKRLCNPNHCHTSESKRFKVLCLPHIQKTGGGVCEDHIALHAAA